MIMQYLRKRRATSKLEHAMRKEDLAMMQEAIDQGADMERVKSDFDEPAQHFQMTYEVRGAIPLAIELHMQKEAFALLLDNGAPVPLSKDGEVDALDLFGRSMMGHPWSRDILLLIESSMERRRLAQGTADVPARNNPRPRF